MDLAELIVHKKCKQNKWVRKWAAEKIQHYWRQHNYENLSLQKIMRAQILLTKYIHKSNLTSSVAKKPRV